MPVRRRITVVARKRPLRLVLAPGGRNFHVRLSPFCSNTATWCSRRSSTRKRNRYLGGDKPFGFDVKDGELVPVPSEQAAIRRMVKMRAEGTSLREIAAAMKRDGFEISHMGVDKIVKAAAARGGRAKETAS
jgi:hypothetical protein